MHNVDLTRRARELFAWRALRLAMAVAVVLALLAWWVFSSLASPFDSGVLQVETRQSPTTYYLDADGQPAGFEYDLLAEFARRNNLELKVSVVDSVADLVDGIARGRSHLAAGWLAVTSERSGHFRYGPVYAAERELVVCGPAVDKPGKLADLVGLRVEVVRGSSHAERLYELRQALPDLRWIEVEAASTEDLLERTASGLTDCTVADASTFDVVWHYWPGLASALVLTERRDIAWGLPKTADMRLRQSLADFFRGVREDGWLERLRERYFGHLKRLGEADVAGILGKRTRLLARLKPHFIQAGGETGLDWRLLAALAYQESQWDALATSPTGVRGIMMLTSETADRMGIANRLDPKDSILGGAHYLAMLRDTLSDRIQEPDRTWMALAAYNIGQGHLEDARRLAQSLGRNPDVWSDLKDVLPLLAKSAYAGRLRYGFARGGEARVLTENVRVYYDILKRFEAPASGLELAELQRASMRTRPAI